MPVYLASDVHLRLDRPERGRRLARWLGGLAPDDEVVLVGDVCDFWFASRQRRSDPMGDAGLEALAAFRDRGGSVTILPGNHDTWLGPFYERTLGARYVPGPLDLRIHGLKVHLVHGHLLGARPVWKGVMEGRAFLHAFGLAPPPLARGLDLLLDRANAQNRLAVDRKHRALYRRYADEHAADADLVVFGHIHSWLNDATRPPRMVILGGWHHGSSYLKVDPTGAWLVVEGEGA